MEAENPKDKEKRRLMIWAVIFIVLSIIVVFFLDIQKGKELLLFWKEIIMHLIL